MLRWWTKNQRSIPSVPSRPTIEYRSTAAGTNSCTCEDPHERKRKSAQSTDEKLLMIYNIWFWLSYERNKLKSILKNKFNLLYYEGESSAPLLIIVACTNNVSYASMHYPANRATIFTQTRDYT